MHHSPSRLQRMLWLSPVSPAPVARPGHELDQRWAEHGRPHRRTLQRPHQRSHWGGGRRRNQVRAKEGLVGGGVIQGCIYYLLEGTHGMVAHAAFRWNHTLVIRCMVLDVLRTHLSTNLLLAIQCFLFVLNDWVKMLLCVWWRVLIQMTHTCVDNK